GTTTHMTMGLVVRRDGGAELHDIDAKGRLLARTTIAPARIDKLALAVGEPAWEKLVHERGSPVPDGASCEILANHRRVKRFDDPADEPIVKEVWKNLHEMWADADRAWVDR